MNAKEVLTELFYLMDTEVDVNEELMVGTRSTISITEAKKILDQYEK